METEEIMKNKILINLREPALLEKLYRDDKLGFKRAFNTVYADLEDQFPARYWYERLNFTGDEITPGKGLMIVVISAVLSGFLTQLPAIFSLNEEFFFTRNAGFIIFPALTGYFIWKNKLSIRTTGFLMAIVIASALYINLLPATLGNDILVLVCLHIPIVLWAVLGMAFTRSHKNSLTGRLDYLKFNGDLLVMSALIGIAGAITTGLTIGLFEIVGLDIEKFYFENIALFCLPAIPITASYLTRNNSNLVGKVSPVIARIFSPVVLVMLTIYLPAIFFSEENIYHDREFLLTFNLLLIGVMALIFFSVAGKDGNSTGRAETMILLGLSVLTIVINAMALSAILFRISEWGITPNRTAVLGTNILILVNLMGVTVQLFKVLRNKAEISTVGKAIARYLPVYVLWALVVVVVFPLLFGWG